MAKAECGQGTADPLSLRKLGPNGEPLRRAIRYLPGIQTVFCALIFLAFAMAPVVGVAGSASPMGSAMHSGCDQHHSSHDGTGLQLCSMSVCHPGVFIELEPAVWTKQRYVYDAGILPTTAGVRPELELPPPRSMV